MIEGENEFDLFMSYSHADSEAIVEALVGELEAYGVDVWYDKGEVQIGNSITESIDEGLRQSNFGVVVLSEGYFEGTSQWELNGLVTRHNREDNVILPLWHGIDYDFVVEQSASLADLRAEKLTNENIQDIATELYHAVERDETEVEDWGTDEDDATVDVPSYMDINIRFQSVSTPKSGRRLQLRSGEITTRRTSPVWKRLRFKTRSGVSHSPVVPVEP
jgi:hypothetical protein